MDGTAQERLANAMQAQTEQANRAESATSCDVMELELERLKVQHAEERDRARQLEQRLAKAAELDRSQEEQLATMTRDVEALRSQLGESQKGLAAAKSEFAASIDTMHTELQRLKGAHARKHMRTRVHERWMSECSSMHARTHVGQHAEERDRARQLEQRLAKAAELDRSQQEQLLGLLAEASGERDNASKKLERLGNEHIEVRKCAHTNARPRCMDALLCICVCVRACTHATHARTHATHVDGSWWHG